MLVGSDAGAGGALHRIAVQTDDEIGRLSRSFNEMVARLKEQSLELQESEESYRLLTENVSDMIFSLDAEARFVFINRRIEQISGRSRDEYIGRDFLDLLTPESREAVKDKLHKIRAEKEVSSVKMEVTLPIDEGDERYFEVVLVKTFEQAGTVRFYGVGRDITERKQMQQQLVQTEKLSSLGEIISGVAHELNNPLTAIMGLSELLRMDPEVDSMVKDELQKVHHEAGRCARIVQNLLTFARRYRPEKKYCHINDLIESVLEVRSYEMNVSHIKVVRNMDPELPATMADPHQLRQVFLNIINNAIQAMQEKPGKRVLRVSTASVATEAVEDTIRIIFEDSGPGVPQQQQVKIFDPFFTTKEVGKGTGLGLSISYGIIEEHGGKIFVQSEKGAKFIIELPMEEALDGFQEKKAPKQALKLPPLRILVVDDEKAILNIVEKVLEREGCRVDSAEAKRSVPRARVWPIYSIDDVEVYEFHRNACVRVPLGQPS